MIKRLSTLIILVCFLITFCSCKAPQKSNIPPVDKIAEQVEETMLNMTLDEKIAQMIILEADKNGVLPSPAPGGVILFAEHFTAADETKSYISSLQSQSELPLIISVDQEGGRVQRLSNLTSPTTTYIPPMYELGKTGDVELANEVGRVMAIEMGALGVNVTFAPVLDVFSNPDNTVIGNRSFSENPNVASNIALSLADGLYENGVMPVYKHFPGHGDTATDSHYALPIINKTKAELYKNELIPFAAAIKNGAEMIMVGHIALPAVTGNNIPSTLSKTIITDLLKTEMGYEGLVITDSLRMKALTNNYSDEEIYKMAIEAGVDLLLMPNNPELAAKVIKENFSEERINQSVEKILYYKFKNLSNPPKYDISLIGSAEHKNIIDKINR